MSAYWKPEDQFIGRDDYRELYKAEDALTNALTNCANLWQQRYDPDGNFWARAVPQALYDLLNNYSNDLVRVVIRKWLEKHPGGVEELCGEQVRFLRKFVEFAEMDEAAGSGGKLLAECVQGHSMVSWAKGILERVAYVHRGDGA